MPTRDDYTPEEIKTARETEDLNRMQLDEWMGERECLKAE
jgi:hypothetical protein